MKAVVGHRYQHFKGREYTVLALARDSETLEEVVVYEANYTSPEFGDRSVWVRPRPMFEEQIVREGETRERFTDITQKT